jgi:hypothetical protein
MRFSVWLAATALFFLPVLVLGATSTTPQVINFDPSKNIIGSGSNTVASSQGSISALTYLSGGDDPATIGIRIINIALTFLSTISMLLILYGGFVWFTARDNEEQAKHAKDILVGAITGFVITASAYGIAYTVFYFAATSAGGTISG